LFEKYKPGGQTVGLFVLGGSRDDFRLEITAAPANWQLPLPRIETGYGGEADRIASSKPRNLPK